LTRRSILPSIAALPLPAQVVGAAP